MSLFPALMFLLVLAVLGISALNSTLMQEKMVSNAKDSNLAFQAAEAALRDAEADVELNNTFWTPTSSRRRAPAAFALRLRPGRRPCSLDISKAIDWTNSGLTRSYGSHTAAPALPDVAAQPQYVIERIPPPPACRPARGRASEWDAEHRARPPRRDLRIGSPSSRRERVRKHVSCCSQHTS